MFRRAGLEVPINVVDTTAVLLIKPLLQQTDALNVMPIAVARYYESQRDEHPADRAAVPHGRLRHHYRGRAYPVARRGAAVEGGKGSSEGDVLLLLA
jgi:hypothetical protein